MDDQHISQEVSKGSTDEDELSKKLQDDGLIRTYAISKARPSLLRRRLPIFVGMGIAIVAIVLVTVVVLPVGGKDQRIEFQECLDWLSKYCDSLQREMESRDNIESCTVVKQKTADGEGYFFSVHCRRDRLPEPPVLDVMIGATRSPKRIFAPPPRLLIVDLGGKENQRVIGQLQAKCEAQGWTYYVSTSHTPLSLTTIEQRDDAKSRE